MTKTIPEEVIKKWYVENRNQYNCLVDRDYILKKSETIHIFSNSMWGEDECREGNGNYDPKIHFGINSGILFKGNSIIFFYKKYGWENTKLHLYGLNDFSVDKLKRNPLNSLLEESDFSFNDESLNKIWVGVLPFKRNGIEFSIIEKIVNQISFEIIRNIEEEKERERLINIDLQIKEEFRLKVLEETKSLEIRKLDTDGNGEVDLIECDTLNKLLIKHQKTIIDLDKIYIQKFVKVTLYLKTKKNNIQILFENLNQTRDTEELKELVNLLQNQIHLYELLVFHSINMITSIVEVDLITFYEIYECFDQLGVFNSNWENEVSEKLKNIGDGISDLMYSINHMESKIVDSIKTLTYITQESFTRLRGSVDKQLSSIDSSIKFNNLLTGIQTYQLYRINQNTKGLN
jgi:hypothetical protein